MRDHFLTKFKVVSFLTTTIRALHAIHEWLVNSCNYNFKNVKYLKNQQYY